MLTESMKNLVVLIGIAVWLTVLIATCQRFSTTWGGFLWNSIFTSPRTSVGWRVAILCFFFTIISSPDPKGHVSYCHHWASVRPLTFHILINSSEAAGPIWTKLWWNGPWMAPFQHCVRWSRLPTKMAAKLKIEKRGDEILIVDCCFSISQNEFKF
jgi:hypothetical protein